MFNQTGMLFRLNILKPNSTMKLNDPFGRVEQKKQSGYESLRTSLIKSGVCDLQSAQALLVSMKKRAIHWALITFAILLIVYFVAPGFSTIAFTLGGIFLFWLLVTSINGISFVKRYIREELGGNASDSE